jgi:hypothetical protein
MPEGSFGTGIGAGRFVLSDRNPNPLEGCACSPGSRHEDSGPPFAVFTASVPQTRNEHNFVVCAGCIGQAACQIQDGAELLGLGGGTPDDAAVQVPAQTAPDGEEYVHPRDRAIVEVVEAAAPPRHVNPVGDSLEEVERQLDARDDELAI